LSILENRRGNRNENNANAAFLVIRRGEVCNGFIAQNQFYVSRELAKR